MQRLWEESRAKNAEKTSKNRKCGCAKSFDKKKVPRRKMNGWKEKGRFGEYGGADR